MFNLNFTSQRNQQRSQPTCAHLCSQKGFSLVEVVVVSALIALIFGGLFTGVTFMLEIIGHSKAEAGARALAVSQMEYIRSLPYDDVGTVEGIPSGSIPQNSTTTLNSIEYQQRVLIQFLDRPEDGFATLDYNGITEDSKIIKLEYTWNIRGREKSITLVSDIIPPGIESTTGGGTLLINVFDAQVAPVEGATIHVFNDSVATDTIDVTVSTNAKGIANFPGAPARSGYQITASKVGYSTDQTYSASSTNQSPNPPHVAVAAGAVSTLNFAIDEVSDLTLRTISTPVTSIFVDSFTGTSSLFLASSTEIASSSIVLQGGPSSYVATGTVLSVATTPGTITSWESFDFNGTSTTDTAFRVRLYSVAGSGTTSVYTLVPDAVLANNSVGFVNGPINITDVDPSVYPTLALGGTLTTTDGSQTAELYDWQLTHVESQSPLSGVTLSIDSDKTIGTHGGQPVLKYTNTVSTDVSGEALLSGIEWDSYTVNLDGAVEGYDLKESYSPLPYALLPGVNDVLTLVLEPYASYSLRVTVTDTLGQMIAGATANLSNGTVDQTQETSIYGQTFFSSGIASATDYVLAVSAPGYDPDTITDLSITGTTEIAVVLALEGTTPPPEEEATTTSTFLAGYDTRVPIEIAGESIFGAVTDFPVYLDLSTLPASVFANLQSDGDDIRVTQGDGLSEVPREVVWVDTGSQTGEVHFKAPSLTISTTSTFYIYYGHATATDYAASDTYGSDNVWTNNFKAVYHLQEEQSGSGNAGVYIDSSGSGAHGDDYIRATDKTGKLGLGQEFDNGDTDFIEIPYTVLDGETDVTTSFWYRTNTNNYMTVLSGAKNDSSNGANEYLFWFRDRNDIQFFSHGNPRVNFDISNINDNSYRHYVSVRDDVNNQTRLYINASEDNQSPATDAMTTLDIASGGLYIGVDQDDVGGAFGQYLDGELDELRIADVVRSAGWISNTYSNQNNPTGFYTVGSVETE